MEHGFIAKDGACLAHGFCVSRAGERNRNAKYGMLILVIRSFLIMAPWHGGQEKLRALTYIPSRGIWLVTYNSWNKMWCLQRCVLTDTD